MSDLGNTGILSARELAKLKDLGIWRDYVSEEGLLSLIEKYQLTGFNRGLSCRRGARLVSYAWATTLPEVRDRIRQYYPAVFSRYKNPVQYVEGLFSYFNRGSWDKLQCLDHYWGAKCKAGTDDFSSADVFVSVPYAHTLSVWRHRLAPRLREMGCDVRIEERCYYPGAMAVVIRFPEKSSVFSDGRSGIASAILYNKPLPANSAYVF